MRTLIKIMLLVVGLQFVLYGSTECQWRKVFNFSSQVVDVSFTPFTSTPTVGFVSLFAGVNNPTNPDKLWRTLDGGYSWAQLVSPRNLKGEYVTPSSFSFESPNIGYCTEFWTISGLYKTQDGGLSWVQIADRTAVAVSYNQNSNRVILSGSPAISFSVDGLNFTGLSFNQTPYTIGIAFSDGVHGVISGGNASPSQSLGLVTSDAGVTWRQTSWVGEQYQPVGLPGTSTFFSLTEQSTYPNTGTAGTILRSDDGGSTWRKLYQYRSNADGASVTGTLQWSDAGLFFQTISDSSEGIMYSEDSGVTFITICGPTNTVDTRFYVKDTAIYAGDKYGGLWLNTTGIGSPNGPRFSATTVNAQFASCVNSFDTIITFSYFDDCNGRQAKLVSAAVTGSPNFSVVAPSDAPRVIHQGDSLILHYNGLGTSDTSHLHIRFHLGWKDLDTTIVLTANAKSAVLSKFSASTLSLGQTFCNAKDSELTFTFRDTCSGTNAELVSASLSGSANFSLLAPWDAPRTIHADDSIVVRYDPQSSGNDAAQLHLKFRLGSTDYDTTIFITGAGRIPRENITLTPAFAASGVTVGKTVDLLVTPDKAVSGRRLSKIAFDLLYNGDLLEAEGTATNLSGVTVTGTAIPLIPGKDRGVHINLIGNDLSLDPATAIARVTFRAYLTDSSSTSVTISNLILNDGDQNFADCLLSADTSATTFTLARQCGDSVLSRYLHTRGLFIESIRPNPGSSAVTLSVHSEADGVVEVELVNALGAVVADERRGVLAGTNAIEVATSSLPNGVYYVRVRAGGRVVGGSVVIQR